MKTIVIGDIHGRDSWKFIMEQEGFNKIIFLGDYFDSKENISAKAQMKNFEEILLLKATNPEKVVLLIGNHDFHYMPLCQAIGEWIAAFSLVPDMASITSFRKLKIYSKWRIGMNRIYLPMPV